MWIENIGIGVIVLIVVWIVTLIIFVVGIKFESNIAWVALALTSTATAILLLIPSEDPNKPLEHNFVKDYDFLYRIIFLSILVFCAFLSFILFFCFHCIESIRLPKQSLERFTFEE